MRSFIRGAALAAGGVGLALAAAALASSARRREDLRGKLVLITGGSRGLGLALAREFGRQGCRVAICARNPEELNRAKSLLEQEGIPCHAARCDVSDPEQVKAMIREVRTQGQIDILVNNAGEILVAPIENTTVPDFERAMDVMFWGVVYPSLEVLDEMKARRSGAIVAITSIGGKVSVPHLIAYSCAKAAANAFCEGLHAEMAPYGVRVTAIAPGLMRTGSHVNAIFKGQQASEAKWFSAAATLPFVSMKAERAARETVEAVRDGKAVKVLSLKASLLARFNGAFPGVVPALLAGISPWLPSNTGDDTEVAGRDLMRDQGRVLRTVTALGESAGARLNQPSV